MKALITGFSGQDSHYLTALLLKNNYELIGVDLNVKPNSKFTIYNVDLIDSHKIPEEWNKREKIKEESEEMEMATLGDEFGRKKGKELKEYDTQDFIDAPMKEIKQKKEREEKIDKEMEKDYGPKDKEEIEKKEKRERLERETEPSLRDISKEYGIDYIEEGDD